MNSNPNTLTKTNSNPNNLIKTKSNQIQKSKLNQPKYPNLNHKKIYKKKKKKKTFIGSGSFFLVMGSHLNSYFLRNSSLFVYILIVFSRKQ